MRRIINSCTMLLVLLAFGEVCLQAQYLVIDSISSSNYPALSARIQLKDSLGYDVGLLQKSEFSLKENGTSIVPLDLVVHDANLGESGATMFAIDHSASMAMVSDTEHLKTRLDQVQAAIDAVFAGAKTEKGIYYGCESFSSLSTINSPLSTDISSLLAGVHSITPLGGTEYNDAFLSTKNGAISALARIANVSSRQIVFITDGNPDHAVLTDSIVHLCWTYGIKVYAICLSNQAPSSLTTIASQTHGAVFIVHGQQDLTQVLALLLEQFRMTRIVEVQWHAPYVCNEAERVRNVELTFQRGFSVKANSSYTAPPSAVAKLVSDPAILSFGPVPPNSSVTRQIKLHAINAPFTISSASIIPASYFTIVDFGGRSLPLTLQPGDELTVTVRFTQGLDTSTRNTALVFESQPCSARVTVVGGSKLFELLSPSTLSSLNSCDTMHIHWTGGDSTGSYSVWYSLNADSTNPTWIRIADSVRAEYYDWTHPVTASNIRIRVRNSIGNKVTWARDIGGRMDETVGSLALDAQRTGVYVCGGFLDTMHCLGQTRLPYGDRDAFLAHVTSDGTLLWLSSFGGSGTDRLNAVCADTAHGLYAAGDFGSYTMSVGSETLHLAPLDYANVFVAALNDDGSPRWAASGGGTSTNSSIVHVDSIACDHGQVYLSGQFTLYLRMQSSSLSSGTWKELDGSTKPQAFTATYDANGVLLSLVATHVPHAYTTSAVDDGLGNGYSLNLFSGVQNNGAADLNLVSLGGTDISLRKWSLAHDMDALSSTPVSVNGDPWTFAGSVMNFGSVAVDSTVDGNFSFLLRNATSVDQVISGIEIIGADSSMFSILSPNTNHVVAPGTQVPIRLRFRPTRDGGIAAYLVVRTACNVDTIMITGVGYIVTDVVDDSENDNSISPNPSSGTVRLHCTAAMAAALRQIELYNTVGELEERITLNAGNAITDRQLDFHTCARGAHVLVFRSERGIIARRKIVLY